MNIAVKRNMCQEITIIGRLAGKGMDSPLTPTLSRAGERENRGTPRWGEGKKETHPFNSPPGRGLGCRARSYIFLPLRPCAGINVLHWEKAS